MESNKYYVVTIEVKDAADLEAVNAKAMHDFSCDGVEEFALQEARVDEILGDRAYSGGDVPDSVIDEVEVVTKKEDKVSYNYYFYQDTAKENASKFFEYLNELDFILGKNLNEKENEDWNSSWREHYSPIEVSDNIHVVPEWFKEKNEPHHVYIYPGMGFGTGEHETTYLCLKLYDEIISKFNENDNCFDFGCGSGILGIAAIKLNKMKVDFCDIDVNALDNCFQNLELNFDLEKEEGHLLVSRERYKGNKRYKLVFANILENVLICEKPIILDALDDNSYLIVSGILNDQVENIKKEYSQLKVENTLSKGDWSAILFSK